MHCSQDPQVRNSANFKLKLGLIHTFTNYFTTMFLAINDIQTDPRMNIQRDKKEKITRERCAETISQYTKFYYTLFILVAVVIA